MAGAGAIVPVGEARAALPALEASHTHAIGVIKPPPDILAIVLKTAQFVGRNGVEFEKRILANEANNQKFNFLKDGDPYNAFYRQKVAEFSAADKGEGAADGDKAAAAGSAAPAAAAPAPAPAPVAAPPKPALPPTKPLEAPEEEQYTVHIPEGLTALDLDTIKLTAQFVARNGKSFLTGLASREHANPQFNFLKPTHSLFGFFTALCDAYSRVLMPPKDLRQKLEKDVADRSVILERALKRLEWERVQEKEAKEKAAKEEAEREAMLSVDWHDFTVVETIEFYDDETDELPAPMTLKEVMRAAKASQQYVEPEPEEAAAAATAAAQQRMDMDEEEKALVAQGAAAGGAAAAAAAGGEEDMDMDMEESDEEGEQQRRQAAAAAAAKPPEEEEEEGPMRVVKNYQRPGARQQQPYDPTKFVVSPITGELIPIGEMAEHMRISLIDPKYREQKEAMMAKIRDTTKASDDEISRNLVSLTRTLPHIFGSTQEEMSALVGKQIAEQRAKEAAAARAAAPVPIPQGPAQPLPEPAVPLPEMPPVAVPPPGMAPPPQAPAPAAAPPTLPPPPTLAPPPQPAGVRPPPPAAAPPPAAMPPPPAAAPPPQRPPPQEAPPPMRPPPPMPAPPPMAARPPMPPMPPPMGGPPPLPPMPPPMGGPPPLPHEPPLPEGEPEAKRPRTDTFVLAPEEEFADQHPGQQTVYVQCPKVDGSDALTGQLLAVEMPSLMASVGDLKARLSEVVSLPPGKQQLSREHVGILKNELTLAFYNVGADVHLQLGLKERGGRKK